MNTIFIVLPILTLLMFDLELTLKPADFKLIAHCLPLGLRRDYQTAEIRHETDCGIYPDAF